MRTKHFFVLILVCLLGVSCVQPVSRSTSEAPSATPAPGSPGILDVSDSGAWKAAVAAGRVVQGSVLVKTLSSVDPGVFTGLGAAETGRFVLPSGIWHHLTVAAGAEAKVILALRSLPGVLSAEQENILSPPKSPGAQVSGRAAGSVSFGHDSSGTLVSFLNDPYTFSAQYSLAVTGAFDAYEAYPLPAGPAVDNQHQVSPYVADIDTGINLGHEDLASGSQSTFTAYSMFTTGSTSSPASGFTYVGDGNNPVSVPPGANWDDDGHGTHTAGIIAALGNNGVGMAGVLWRGANLISYKIGSDTAKTGSFSDWAIYGSLYWLTNQWTGTVTLPQNILKIGHKNQITLPVNMSLGGPYATNFASDMVEYALKNNVLVIASMGNDCQTLSDFPAGFAGVIAVGATDANDQKVFFSTTGSWISVGAPGFGVVSTYNGSPSEYYLDSGTSMSAPFVTGLVAYMISQSPSLLPDQIKAILEDTADDVAGTKSSNWGYLGAGRVNVKRALDEAVGKNGRTTPASGSVYTNNFETVKLTSSLTDAPVFLYDSSGNFVHVAQTSYGYGSSTLSVATGIGTVTFGLLKQGMGYTATANGHSVTFTGGAGGPAPVISIP